MFIEIILVSNFGNWQLAKEPIYFEYKDCLKCKPPHPLSRVAKSLCVPGCVCDEGKN